MKLTPEQTATLSEWLTQGDSLSAVQTKLAETFNLSLTYMELRFLVDDLGLAVKASQPAPSPASSEDSGATQPGEEGGEEGEPITDGPPEDLAAEPAMGGVSVALDLVSRPGAVVSGSVTFSDGVSGTWALDQMGRLMLDTGSQGYSPPQEDIPVFQRELSAQLEKRGL